MNGYHIESMIGEMESLWYTLDEVEDDFIKNRYSELIGGLSNLAEILFSDYQRLRWLADMSYKPTLGWLDFAIRVLLENLSQTLIEETFTFDPEELQKREAEREENLNRLNRNQLRNLFSSVTECLENYYELLEAYLFIKGMREASSEDRSLTYENMKWER